MRCLQSDPRPRTWFPVVTFTDVVLFVPPLVDSFVHAFGLSGRKDRAPHGRL